MMQFGRLVRQLLIFVIALLAIVVLVLAMKQFIAVHGRPLVRIDVNTELTTVEGEPLRMPPKTDDQGTVVEEGKVMTLADVLKHIALLPPPQTQDPGAKVNWYKPKSQIMRWQLAWDVHQASLNKESGVLEVHRRVIREIEDDLCRIYAPMIGGQVLVRMGLSSDDYGPENEVPRPQEVPRQHPREREMRR